MDSMETIYREHARTVYGFLLAKTRNPELAEELTQETFYQALKNLDSFRGNSSVSTWLCGIAKRLWYNSLQKQKRQQELSSALSNQEQAAWEESAEEAVFQEMNHMELLKRLHRLKEPGREVMYLRLISDLTFAQIGEIMGHSENWARVTYYRAKEAYRRMSGDPDIKKKQGGKS